MSFEIAEMTVDDYEEAIRLWEYSEGLSLSGADSRERIAPYLQQNRALSYVVRDKGQLVGAVLCGSDGRWGYLHHMAVAETHRRGGIGRAMVERCVDALRSLGIDKCYLFAFTHNAAGQQFYKKMGWCPRGDLAVMLREIDEDRSTARGGSGGPPRKK